MPGRCDAVYFLVHTYADRLPHYLYGSTVCVQSAITDEFAVVFLFTHHFAVRYACNRVYYRVTCKVAVKADNGCNDFFPAVDNAFRDNVSGNYAT